MGVLADELSPCEVRAECDVWAARLLAVVQRRGGDGEVPMEAGVGSFVGDERGLDDVFVIV